MSARYVRVHPHVELFDLITDVHTKTGFSLHTVENVIKGVLREIKEALQQGEHVSIVNFGRFTVRQRRTRPGRNPKTGESIVIMPRKVVVFQPRSKLRIAVSRGNPLVHDEQLRAGRESMPIQQPYILAIYLHTEVSKRVHTTLGSHHPDIERTIQTHNFSTSIHEAKQALLETVEKVKGANGFLGTFGLLMNAGRYPQWSWKVDKEGVIVQELAEYKP